MWKSCLTPYVLVMCVRCEKGSLLARSDYFKHNIKVRNVFVSRRF